MFVLGGPLIRDKECERPKKDIMCRRAVIRNSVGFGMRSGCCYARGE